MISNRPVAYLTGRLATLARAARTPKPISLASCSAAPAAQTVQARRHWSSAACSASGQQQSTSSDLTSRLIYSTRAHNSNTWRQTARRHLANTTAGTFAPSNFDGLARAKQRLDLAVDGSQDELAAAASSLGGADQLNIFDDSDHLPSLPVPRLGETLERLRETIWPIAMNSSEFAHALELIEAFAGSPGQKLDLLLRVKASQTKNWLTHDWWTQEAYLKSRAPLVINSNPAMIYPRLPASSSLLETKLGEQQRHVQAEADQRKLISTVAQLVSGVIDFKLALLQGYNPECSRASGGGAQLRGDEFTLRRDLCYNQYRHIFGSTRLPGAQMDSINFKPLNDDLEDLDVAALSNKFNLVVSHRGQFFEIQLSNVDNSNEQARIDTLVSVLSKIIDYSTASSQQSRSVGGVGILTADRRDRWASNIRLLDAESLRAIREAHLMVCLDTIPREPEDKFLRKLLDADSSEHDYMEALLRQVLHADRANVANRWFDKSLQLIVVTDDASQRFLGAGINYEHSVAEAVVVTKLIEFSHNKVVQQLRRTNHQRAADQQQQQQQQVASSGDSRDGDESESYSTAVTPARYRRLKMIDDARADEVSALIGQVRADFKAQLDQFGLAYFSYKQYGSGDIKSWRFSPDSWFQVAMQLAHYQLHKRLGPCYETASTRQFAYGRTETIRSLTKDVAEFCQAPSLETMKAAIESHKSYANAANNASAIDRVLLGYRLIFNELRTNNWAWGLPTLDECDSAVESTDGDQHARKLRYQSLEDTKREQQVDLNDLFTEKELSTLSAFFNNELIERSKKFALSTSQVASLHPEICMSYGPLLADGYACCYNISGQQIVAAITANSSNQSFSCAVDKFSESLSEALDKMRDIIVESQEQQQQEQLIQQQQQRSSKSNP